MTALAQISRPAIRRPIRLETADGARLHHIEWGEGRPILFVHAWALSSEMWKSQMVHLADRGFRCIAFDCRGHGRSDDPADVSAPIAITGDRLAAGLPHADYKVYDGAPHGLFATHQARLNADLEAFLA